MTARDNSRMYFLFFFLQVTFRMWVYLWYHDHCAENFSKQWYQRTPSWILFPDGYRELVSVLPSLPWSQFKFHFRFRLLFRVPDSGFLLFHTPIWAPLILLIVLELSPLLSKMSGKKWVHQVYYSDTFGHKKCIFVNITDIYKVYHYLSCSIKS